VPSSAADTNWAAQQVAFEQALASYLLTPPTWLAPSLVNSWANYGSGNQNAGYYKDTAGTVHLRGLIKSGASLSTAFTLPSGYRPLATETLIGATATGIAGIVIASTGVVTVVDLINSTCTTSTSLANLSFSTV
jgi:hypothetical protein